eukprot:1161840-Pelagomonas_calceolata.AAC.2
MCQVPATKRAASTCPAKRAPPVRCALQSQQSSAPTKQRLVLTFHTHPQSQQPSAPTKQLSASTKHPSAATKRLQASASTKQPSASTKQSSAVTKVQVPTYQMRPQTQQSSGPPHWSASAPPAAPGPHCG